MVSFAGKRETQKESETRALFLNLKKLSIYKHIQ